MNNLSDDIIKYKKGELSPKEMHALEKKALSDPFLADALEGADEISSEDFFNDVQSIKEKIKGKKRRTIFFTPLRIAAGVLVVISASFIVYQLIPKSERLALQTSKEKPKSTVDSAKNSALTEQAATQQAKQEEKKEPIQTKPTHSIAKAKQKAPDEIKTSGPTKTNPVEPSTVAQVSEQPAAIKIDKPVDLSEEKEMASGLLQTEEKKTEDVAQVAPKQVMARKKEAVQTRAEGLKQITNHPISGQVLSATDGSPMPGVNVMIKGTTTGTVTDANGSFKLDLNQPDQSLVFSFIGFEAQEVSAGEKDKLDVSLKEDATQLSEVVVTGYGLPKDPEAEPIIKLAEPVGGRKAYDKYLDDNLRYPQQALESKVKGRVVIEFTVRVDGSLDEFNVIKKLGYGCDEEVIRLVKEGPAWKPTTQDNVAIESNVRVRMKFNPEKKK